MRRKTGRAPSRPMTIAEMAEEIMVRTKKIKSKHPRIAKNLAMHEEEVRKHLAKLKFEMAKLPQRESELVTILTVSRLEKLIEDILGGGG